MISFTLETAVGVSVTGALGVVSTPGVEVVAMFFVSLSLRVSFRGYYTHFDPDSIALTVLDAQGRAWVAEIPRFQKTWLLPSPAAL
jgi:hypothetical protein